MENQLDRPARPVGVTIAAIMLILGSALLLFAAVAETVAALVSTSQPPQPAFLKPYLLCMAVLMCIFTGLGIATAIGLIRLRRLARLSILIFSGLLAALSLLSAIFIAFVPIPPTPGAPPNILFWLRMAMAVFYLFLASIGGWWLFYFNRARVRSAFRTGAGAGKPSGRPLSISILAWLLFAGGVFGIMGIFLPLPIVVFGLVVSGPAAHVGYLLLAVIQVALGVGLLRLHSLSRAVAIGYFIFGLLNSTLFLALPGYQERLHRMFATNPAFLYPPRTDAFVATILPFSYIFGMIVSLIFLWFLIARRSYFIRPLTPSAAEPNLKGEPG